MILICLKMNALGVPQGRSGQLKKPSGHPPGTLPPFLRDDFLLTPP